MPFRAAAKAAQKPPVRKGAPSGCSTGGTAGTGSLGSGGEGRPRRPICIVTILIAFVISILTSPIYARIVNLNIAFSCMRISPMFRKQEGGSQKKERNLQYRGYGFFGEYDQMEVRGENYV